MNEKVKISRCSFKRFGRTVAIIQARMGSSRLPGKVLKEIEGQPMLVRVIERATRSKLADAVVIATTTNAEDDAIAALCASRGYAFYRGEPLDVLDRYYRAALRYAAQTIIRLTADCPLIDPDLIDRTVSFFRGDEGVQPNYTPTKERPYYWDFTANRLPPPWKRTYPIGLDVEVCSFHALERAWKEAKLSHQREHVMPYLYESTLIADSRDMSGYYEAIDRENTSSAFRALVVHHHTDFGRLRWAVDTAQDLEMIRKLFRILDNSLEFSWLDILKYFQEDKALLKMNKEIKQKSVYE